MNLKQALKRIEELERRVQLLEARQPAEYHYHFPQQPIYAPLPVYPAPLQPWQPAPWNPWYITTAGATSALSVSYDSSATLQS